MHAAEFATAAEAGLPDHRAVRGGQPAPGTRVDAGDHRARRAAGVRQRTRRIHLGTAVIPLGWENPLRLAEDLATVDILSGGRLNPGVSVGPPTHYDQVRHVLYPDTGDIEGLEVFSGRVQPHAPGLGRRMWYGGASLRSAQWAGENGMNFLTSSVVKAEGSGDFAGIQLARIRTFRAHHRDGDRARVSQGLVVIPTDTASAEQRRKYEEFARRRMPRTAAPQGPARLLTDIATRLGPALGWQPAADPEIGTGT